MTDTILSARGLRLALGGRQVLDGAALDIPRGQVTTLIGANGCGKSTLLRCLARLQLPDAGEVRLDGQPITALAGRALARRLAVLPQGPVAPEGIRVAELVARGRTPHLRPFRPAGPADAAAIARAMETTGTADLAGRRVDTLSGGQRQRVWVAMALAQETELLLLDEPTAWLDLAHQIELMRLVRSLIAARGMTVVMVLHELSLAARFSDRIAAMAGGRIVAMGPPAEVMTPARLREVVALEAAVIPDPLHGGPMIVPH